MTEMREKAESVATDLLELCGEMCALMGYLMGEDVCATWRNHVALFASDLVNLAQTIDERGEAQ